MFALCGFVKERRNEAARIGAAHVNHPGPQRAEDTVPIVKERLRWPIVSLAGTSPGLLNRAPYGMKLCRAWRVKIRASEKGVVGGVNLLPPTAFHGFEKAFHIVGHFHFETFGQSVNQVTPATGKLAEFAGDDLLRGSRRRILRTHSARLPAMSDRRGADCRIQCFRWSET